MRRLAGAISVAIILIGAVVGAFILGTEAYRAPGALVETRTVVIESGTGVQEIAEQLASQGVIESPLLFRVATRLRGDESGLKAGEYAFPAGISLETVIGYLVDGETVSRRLTIPEGWTVEAVVGLLRETDALRGDIASIPPEGTILPDTYHFALGDKRQVVLDRMRSAMRQHLAAAWQQRAEGVPLASPHEALTLASIVEKETALAEERPVVAAVFVNRLRRGMKLQADPTVVYGIEQKKGELGRPLTRADLETETPFNTYVIEGLPPGPIANPGRDAIRAVLNPASTNYLYFVADGRGGHAFARSLAEHNKNVAKWRQIRNRQRPNN